MFLPIIFTIGIVEHNKLTLSLERSSATVDDYFIQNLGIESDCSIRVFRAEVCVLLEYFNGALYNYK